MRRETLYNSVYKIIEDLKTSNIADFLRECMESFRVAGEQKSNPALLRIFQNYMLATSRYNSDDIEICRVLGIDSLLEAGFWQDLLEIQHPHLAHDMYDNVRFSLEQMPKILNLSKQHYVQDIKDQSQEIPEELKGKSLLTILVIEEDEKFSSPKRITGAINSITELYEVVASIDGQNENDLIVLACDSGSDKSFDFLGLAKVVDQVKEIIIAIWDRKVFHRHRDVSETLSLISESLPILEKINDLKESGAIEREEAELLRRKAISGVTQFFEAGIIIPELDAESSHSPKQLMRPEPKLLVSPWNKSKQSTTGSAGAKVTNNDSNQENGHSSKLSEDEQEMLSLLLKKSKESDDN